MLLKRYAKARILLSIMLILLAWSLMAFQLVDESRLDAGENRLHLPVEEVAHHAALVRPVEHELYQPAVLKDRDPRLLGSRADENLSFQET